MKISKNTVLRHGTKTVQNLDPSHLEYWTHIHITSLNLALAKIEKLHILTVSFTNISTCYFFAINAARLGHETK